MNFIEMNKTMEHLDLSVHWMVLVLSLDGRVVAAVSVLMVELLTLSLGTARTERKNI